MPPCVKFEAISIIAVKGLVIAKTRFELLDPMQKGEFYARRFFFQDNFKTHFRIRDGACEGIVFYGQIIFYLGIFEYAICGSPL